MKKPLLKTVLRQGLCLVVLLTLSCSLFLILPRIATAGPAAGDTATYEGLAGAKDALKKKGEEAFGTTAQKDLPQIVGTIVKSFLGLLGTAAVVLIIYAGVLWMTAGGNEEQIKKAKTILSQAVIGLAIIIAAYAIASFAINALIKAGQTG